ncbi:MAG: FAD:protein FMN transferase [Planctomycetota bacterium]
MRSPTRDHVTPEAVGARAGRLRAFRSRDAAAQHGAARWRAARWCAAGLALLALACAPRGPLEHRLSGRALGTTWSLIVVDEDRSTTPEALRALADAALDEVDRAASTWRDDSELARFAKLAPGESMPLSEHLRVVLDEARFVHDQSGGAFDPTVAPLVALYGFGAGAHTVAPTEAERAAAHARVDFDAVVWGAALTAERPAAERPVGAATTAAATLSRTRGDITLDLSAIAKGYAVDVIAARLRAAGETRFLAEVGGELVLAGTRITGTPWSVSVDEPTEAPPFGPPGSPGRPLHAVLAVSDRGLATSGDYRQYGADAEGHRITHAIDPRAGRAVSNDVASVTVLAPTCMRADALATAVMVLGADDGLALLERLPDVEGLVLLHRPAAATGAPTFEERATTGFGLPQAVAHGSWARPRPE